MIGHPSLIGPISALEAQKSPLSGATRWGARVPGLGIGRLSGPALGLPASCPQWPSGARRRCPSGEPPRGIGRPPASQPGSAMAREGWWGGALRAVIPGVVIAAVVVVGPLFAIFVGLARVSGNDFSGLKAADIDGHVISCCLRGSSPDTTSIWPMARNARGKARNIFRNSQVKQMQDMESLSVMEVTV